MLSLVIYVVMTSYSIAAFPYDNACGKELACFIVMRSPLRLLIVFVVQ
jgi:hypothetical protein